MALANLLDPFGSSFLRDFPSLNAVNLDNIDSYSNACLTSHPLQSFTPTLLASGTNPTLGSGGTNEGLMYRIFDQLYLWGQFRFGTGFSNGNGVYIIQLPFTFQVGIGPSVAIASSPIIGGGATYDASSNAGRKTLTVHMRASNQLQFGTKMNNGLALPELRESGYLTWDVGDGVNWYVRVKAV